MKDITVVFDTNAYRYLTYKSANNNLVISDFFEKEAVKNIDALANPFVMQELCAHLNNKNDPAYQNCREAIGI